MTRIEPLKLLSARIEDEDRPPDTHREQAKLGSLSWACRRSLPWACRRASSPPRRDAGATFLSLR